MGKKKPEKNKLNKSNLPFISICTPTFNRRPFIPFMIKCFEHQTYPKDKIEWIIIDDGTDPIEDLVKDIPQVKYFYYETQMILGKKRNLMHSKCTGDIIIYMDDDDYYPPTRFSHAVEMLLQNPKFLVAGSSEMHLYFKHIQTMYQFGPYGPYHSTAATFAFKKELLKQTSYDESNALSEEKHFLKNYTIPLLQLDTKQTILVFSHIHNSFDKKPLLENCNPAVTKVSTLTIDDFIKDPILKQFYAIDVDDVLKTYDFGKPEHKPKVLEQIQEKKQFIEKYEKEQRLLAETQAKIMNSFQNTSLANMPVPPNTIFQNTNTNVQDIREYYEKQLQDKSYLINELLKKIKVLNEELAQYK
jgi:glycosyltransferase involved in cell wall biosynthesis